MQVHSETARCLEQEPVERHRDFTVAGRGGEADADAGEPACEDSAGLGSLSLPHQGGWHCAPQHTHAGRPQEVRHNEAAMKAVFTVLPSMHLFFCSPAMRPRHWKQVLRYASTPSHLLGRMGTFEPSLLDKLTFGQLLEMNLHSKNQTIVLLCVNFVSFFFSSLYSGEWLHSLCGDSNYLSGCWVEKPQRVKKISCLRAI